MNLELRFRSLFDASETPAMDSLRYVEDLSLRNFDFYFFT